MNSSQIAVNDAKNRIFNLGQGQVSQDSSALKSNSTPDRIKTNNEEQTEGNQ